MKILVAGGTGFIGTALIRELTANGLQPTIVTRSPGKGDIPSVGWSNEELRQAVKEHQAVINLTGESIMDKRWDKTQKERLTESRIGSTKRLVQAVREAKKRPLSLINASAIGFYGPRGDEPLTEGDRGGDDFLAYLSKKWEAEAFRANDLGVRTAVVRIGIVLGKGGGALARMFPPFRLGLGGPLGSGSQVMSWVHISDLCRLFLFILKNEALDGVFNGTAPAPVTNKEFTRALGKALGKPAFCKVPGFALRLALGEVADLLLAGQRVVPQRALDNGFEFHFPELRAALVDILEG